MKEQKQSSSVLSHLKGEGKEKFLRRMERYGYSELCFSKHIPEIIKSGDIAHANRLLKSSVYPNTVNFYVNIYRCLRDKYSDLDYSEVSMPDIAILTRAVMGKEIRAHLKEQSRRQTPPEYQASNKLWESPSDLFTEYICRGMIPENKILIDWENPKDDSSRTIISELILERRKYYLKLENYRVWFNIPFDTFESAKEWLPKMGSTRALTIKFHK